MVICGVFFFTLYWQQLWIRYWSKVSSRSIWKNISFFFFMCWCSELPFFSLMLCRYVYILCACTLEQTHTHTHTHRTRHIYPACVYKCLYALLHVLWSMCLWWRTHTNTHIYTPQIELCACFFRAGLSNSSRAKRPLWCWWGLILFCQLVTVPLGLVWIHYW